MELADLRVRSLQGKSAEEDIVLSRLDIQTKSSFLLRLISQGRLSGHGHTHQLAATPVTFNASLA